MQYLKKDPDTLYVRRPKRRYMQANEEFIKQIDPNTRNYIGLCKRYSYDRWDTLFRRSVLSPYTWCIAWDVSENSLSGEADINVLNVDVPYLLFFYEKMHRRMRGVVQGFLTKEDMQFAIRIISRHELLIGWTVDTKENYGTEQ